MPPDPSPDPTQWAPGWGVLGPVTGRGPCSPEDPWPHPFPNCTPHPCSYYKGIRQMVQVSDQDMNTHLAEISRVRADVGAAAADPAPTEPPCPSPDAPCHVGQETVLGGGGQMGRPLRGTAVPWEEAVCLCGWGVCPSVDVPHPSDTPRTPVCL